MNFLKKLFGLEEANDEYIGLSGFLNQSARQDDEKPEVKKQLKKDLTLTELLRKNA